MKKDPNNKLEGLLNKRRKIRKQIAQEKLKQLAEIGQAMLNGELEKIKSLDKEQLRKMHETLSVLFGSNKDA